MAQETWPDANTESKDYNPWLTVEALGKAKALTILGNPRKSTSQFGDGVIVDVKVGNKEFSWTIKFTSGNYSRLVKKFGKPNRWKGTVAVEVREYLGNEYVAVA